MTEYAFSLITAAILVLAWPLTLSAAENYTVTIDAENNVSGSGYGNYAGDITKITDGSGVNTNGTDGPADWPAGAGLPTTWTYNTTAYTAEWQCTGGNSGLLGGAVNGKIGWLTFDLTKPVQVADLYFWNVRSGGGSAGIKGFNLYFANNAIGVPAPSKVDYEFSSTNGWTQYDDNDADPTTPRYIMPGAGSPYADFTISVSDITARYIGIEVLTNYGSTGRIGLAELGVTATPPPAGTVITLY